jgi:hypothetical protein
MQHNQMILSLLKWQSNIETFNMKIKIITKKNGKIEISTLFFCVI